MPTAPPIAAPTIVPIGVGLLGAGNIVGEGLVGFADADADTDVDVEVDVLENTANSFVTTSGFAFAGRAIPDKEHPSVSLRL
ncbi:hypothetical protein NPX13_g4072 [Xylaria arbuscula]|uniref:Uncharacterized protein n=1 Tax=Xylaria arbuscula TaxID=114810 RepID=A0A9W8NHI6_9PEZI|nr:hypothetical protein NPX13_g4072 [Xylaria arbuscula]